RNRSEVSRLFNLNNVVVEHRYFLESTPEGKNWKYLTAENEANDLHRIVTELKTIFPKKWIPTGSSKGGQNTVIYRSFFPDDVDISVPYVGPFCRGVEDGRHEPFIANFAGTPEARQKILDIQTEFLKRRDRLMPMFKDLVESRGYKYRISLDEAYDYTVLEFSFTFWQRGYNPDRIPDTNISDEELFRYFTGISSPDYWEEESPTTPFFVMAAKELGYYGYDIKPFKGYLTIKSAKHYLKKIWLPKEVKNVRFKKKLSRRLDKFIKKTDCRILFVYGEFDPWSAVRAGDNHGSNVHIFIKPGGSHSSNINTLPEEMKAEALAILSEWLYTTK
ncbi:MAG: aminopeptidase, partial [Bacteroidales bacterium]|nr:aminopeptidase [Bacteroidales bacterium]